MNYAFEQLTNNWLPNQRYISISDMVKKFPLSVTNAHYIVDAWLGMKLIKRDVTCPGLFKVIL